MGEEIDIIRENLKTNKLKFGEKEAIKAVKRGEAKIVFMASNVKERVKQDLERYKKIGDFELKPLNLTNAELGALCKKQYNIAVVTLLK